MSSGGRSAVAEQVDGDHPVAARGHLRRQAVEHAPVHQQPVDQDERAVALAVIVVGDPVAVVAEGAVGIAIGRVY